MWIGTDLPTNWLLSVGIICCFLDGHSVGKGFALKFDKDNWKTWFLLFLDIWQRCMFMKWKLGNNFTPSIRTKILTSECSIDVTKRRFSWCSWIVTARKGSLWMLCFHGCLSVHRGDEAEPPLGRHPPGRHPYQADTPWADPHHHPGQTPPLGTHPPWARIPPGHTPPPWADTPTRQTPPGQTPTTTPGRHPPWARIPPGHTPHSACWNTVNKQAVCIPLECILVHILFTARKRSLGQGNFLHLSVVHSIHKGEANSCLFVISL